MGSQLGKYQLIAEIARGGMGIVYLAVAHGPARFSKLLVVKELKPEYVEDETFLEMFLEEARLAARLNHPNIVQTYEVGEENRRHYLVMDYLDGVTLTKVLRRKSPLFTVNMHLRVICEVLEALEYAHTLKDFDGTDLGIVHRDVNPSNVFVTFDGQAKLVDFGIAKALDSTIETRTGILKGKPAYMAPEQIAGDADPRADIFSAGVMIWEAVAGQRMWTRRSDVEVLAQLLKSEVPSIREAAPDAPEALAQIIEKALAKDREDRYPSARALQDALEDYLKGDDAASMRAVGKIVGEIFAEERTSRRNKIDAQLALLKATSSSGASPGFSSGEGTPSLLPVIGSDVGFVSSSSHGRSMATPTPSSSASDGVPISLPPEAKASKKLPILLGVVALILTALSFVIGVRATNTPASATAPTGAPSDAPPPPTTSASETKPEPTITASAVASSGPPPSPEKPKSTAPARPLWTPRVVRVPTSTPAPAPEARAPSPSSSTNCSPPFYYEGTKKMFKPGCL